MTRIPFGVHRRIGEAAGRRGCLMGRRLDGVTARESAAWLRRGGAGASARVSIAVMLLTMAMSQVAGCSQRDSGQIECFMSDNPLYVRIPQGAQRVDAIWRHATEITGSACEALDLLGSLAVAKGVKLQHPFNTGLTNEGTLSPNDKTGHFFAHAMWQYHDFDRLIPIAKLCGGGWEIVGEIRHWFGSGVGYDWADIWANRLGREFGRRVYHNRDAGTDLRPSGVIAVAESFRPANVRRQPRQ